MPPPPSILFDLKSKSAWVSWSGVLSEAGFEVAHWSNLGLAYAPDHKIMAFAAEHGYVVFTNDLDFGVILSETQAARLNGVQVRVGNLRPEIIGPKVVEALQQLSDGLEKGAFISIDAKKTRVRVLPLGRGR